MFSKDMQIAGFDDELWAAMQAPDPTQSKAISELIE